MTDKSLMEIQDAEIILADDLQTKFGLVSSQTVEAIAANMTEHWRGKVPGGYIPATPSQLDNFKNKPFPPEWREVGGVIYRPGTKKEQGDLLPGDAVRVTQKTLSRGLNPLAHISIWYQNGQLIDNVNYTIIKGMAEQQKPFSFEFREMTPDERTVHGLKQKDIGRVAYLILDSDKPLLLQATISFSGGLPFSEAKLQAWETVKKAKGFGIVRADEGLYTPKGRSIPWIAEKRAGTDAIRRAFGEMTPAQIAHYASGQGFVDRQALKAMASPDYLAIADLPEEDQAFYLRVSEKAMAIEEGKGTVPEADITEATEAMRNNGDDDPLGEQENNPAMDPSSKFWGYAYSHKLSREQAGEFIRRTNGDFEAALKALKESLE